MTLDELLHQMPKVELHCHLLGSVRRDTFADLVSYSRTELMKFRNFGRKSLNEIDLLVEKMKLSFGMDVTKYNIEPKKKNV